MNGCLNKNLEVIPLDPQLIFGVTDDGEWSGVSCASILTLHSVGCRAYLNLFVKRM